MKIEDSNGKKIRYYGMAQDKFYHLTRLVETCLQNKPYVVVCIIGNKGVGKTTLAKLMRKHGFGPFRPKDIAVIDDDCMSVDVLYFFRRKYINPCHGVDELLPFFRLCPKKRIRFYVKSDPETRISHADIVLKVDVNEEKRKARLIQRYGKEKGETVFHRTNVYKHLVKIGYDHLMSAQIQ